MSDDKESAITLGPVTVVRAFRPGDVVFIETNQYYPQTALEAMRKQFKAVSDAIGVRVVLLDCGMKVAAASEAPELAVQP